MNRPKISNRAKVGAVVAAAAVAVGAITAAGYELGHAHATAQEEQIERELAASSNEIDPDVQLWDAIENTYPQPEGLVSSRCFAYPELCFSNLERHPLDYTSVIVYKRNVSIPFDYAVAEQLLTAAHKADPNITKVYVTEFMPPAERTSPTVNGRWVASAELPTRQEGNLS